MRLLESEIAHFVLFKTRVFIIPVSWNETIQFLKLLKETFIGKSQFKFPAIEAFIIH